MSNISYKTRLHTIKAFAFDVDGVMTDGSLFSTPDGDLIRLFYAKDSFAMRMCIMHGFPIAVITGGVSESIVQRMISIGISPENIYQKSRNKLPDLLDFCEKHSLSPAEVAFVGDDLPDIPVLKACGLAVCPCDAATEVKEVCDYVSSFGGGKGCIRELIEQVMKVHGKWVFSPEKYSEQIF